MLFLIENRGRLIEKDEILDAIWNGTHVTENALTREIGKLRKILGDDPLREFLSDIGSAVPRTKFLVYSRGTDTQWLEDGFQKKWKNSLETEFPELKGRIETMTISRLQEGSFRNPETRELLLTNVIKILSLPEKRN